MSPLKQTVALCCVNRISPGKLLTLAGACGGVGSMGMEQQPQAHGECTTRTEKKSIISEAVNHLQ